MTRYNLFYIIFIIFSNFSFATIRYVNISSGLGIAPYTTWETSSNDLQLVINSCTQGDEIWVAMGTYRPTQDVFGSNNPLDKSNITFFVKDGIKIFGGFLGNENQLNQRDFKNNKTILSGDIGTINEYRDNCYHVLTSSGNSSNALGITIDGFYITDGVSLGTQSISINGNTIYNSTGGAMNLNSGNNVISNNFIYNNRGYSCGGIFILKGNNIMNNNNIYQNYSSYSGTAIFVESGYNIIDKNIIHNNEATISGGGIYTLQGTQKITNNFIYDNKCALSALYITYYYGGGAIYADTSNNEIINNVIFGNYSGNEGGGLFLEGGTNKIINNTIYNNKAKIGGGSYTYTGTQNFMNNIFWGNKNLLDLSDLPGTDFGTDKYYSGTNYFNNNIVQLLKENYNSTNGNYMTSLSLYNLYQVNPSFIDILSLFGGDGVLGTTDDGLSISINSSCIDYGIIVGAPTNDITGKIRKGKPDLGAYENLESLANEDFTKKIVFIYPNPTKNLIFISEELNDIVILSSNGQKLISIIRSKEIDISILPKGIYFLNGLDDKKFLHTYKLIKE